MDTINIKSDIQTMHSNPDRQSTCVMCCGCFPKCTFEPPQWIDDMSVWFSNFGSQKDRKEDDDESNDQIPCLIPADQTDNSEKKSNIISLTRKNKNPLTSRFHYPKLKFRKRQFERKNSKNIDPSIIDVIENTVASTSVPNKKNHTLNINSKTTNLSTGYHKYHDPTNQPAENSVKKDQNDECLEKPTKCSDEKNQSDECLEKPTECSDEKDPSDECLEKPTKCSDEKNQSDECLEKPTKCSDEKNQSDECLEKPTKCSDEKDPSVECLEKSTKSSDQTDRAEQSDQTDRAEQSNQTDRAEQSDQTDRPAERIVVDERKDIISTTELVITTDDIIFEPISIKPATVDTLQGDSNSMRIGIIERVDSNKSLDRTGSDLNNKMIINNSDKKYEIIIKNLMLIRTIQQGDKLCVDNNEMLSIDLSYFPSIKRKLTGNNKAVTIKRVVYTINAAKLLKNNVPKIKELMDEQLVAGICNLAETYSKHEDLCKSLKNLASTL
jgi:hypothetical protein